MLLFLRFTKFLNIFSIFRFNFVYRYLCIKCLRAPRIHLLLSKIAISIFNEWIFHAWNYPVHQKTSCTNSAMKPKTKNLFRLRPFEKKSLISRLTCNFTYGKLVDWRLRTKTNSLKLAMDQLSAKITWKTLFVQILFFLLLVQCPNLVNVLGAKIQSIEGKWHWM